MKKKLLLYPAFLFVSLMFNAKFASAKPTTTVVLGVQLDIRVFLKGALANTDGSAGILMRDDLRNSGYLPITEPYTTWHQQIGTNSGGETIPNSVLADTGPNAIVDWLFVELRSPDNPVKILATRSALLQRDGDVVNVDGVSSLLFEKMPAGDYYVSVRHRNHYGVMAATAYALGEIPVALDFTDPDFATWGVRAQQAFLGKMALWAGDFNKDGSIVYQGPNNDIYFLFYFVLSAPGNTEHAPNYIYYGYHNCDYNMDGKVIYTGPDSDRAALLYHTLKDCLTGVDPNCVGTEQLPK